MDVFWSSVTPTQDLVPLATSVAPCVAMQRQALQVCPLKIKSIPNDAPCCRLMWLSVVLDGFLALVCFCLNCHVCCDHFILVSNLTKGKVKVSKLC